MGSAQPPPGASVRRRCGRVRGRARCAVVLAVALVLAGCGEGDDSASGTRTTEGQVTTSSGPDDTGPEATSAPIDTILVGDVVGGNSGGIGENRTDALSETVRTSRTECRGWFGDDTAPEPWTSRLQEGATVQVFDDNGELVGTGALGPGRSRNLLPGEDDDDDNGWQCEFKFSVDVMPASAYFIEVAGLDQVEAEPDPLEPDTVVVPVNTPLDPMLVEACADLSDDLSTLPSTTSSVVPTTRSSVVSTTTTSVVPTVEEWEPVVGSYWSQGVDELCSSGLLVSSVRRQCRQATLSTLQILSVVASDGRVLENRTSDGPAVDTDTLPQGTLVDVNVTSAAPCG